jgi:hypothetical protein
MPCENAKKTQQDFTHNFSNLPQYGSLVDLPSALNKLWPLGHLLSNTGVPPLVHALKKHSVQSTSLHVSP